MEEVAIPCSDFMSLLTFLDFISSADTHLLLSGLGHVVTSVDGSVTVSTNCWCCPVTLSSVS